MSQDNYKKSPAKYQQGILNYGISRGYIILPINSLPIQLPLK
jgi:hypothetical protein